VGANEGVLHERYCYLRLYRVYRAASALNAGGLEIAVNLSDDETFCV
jgi:hypothetical protein